MSRQEALALYRRQQLLCGLLGALLVTVIALLFAWESTDTALQEATMRAEQDKHNSQALHIMQTTLLRQAEARIVRAEALLASAAPAGTDQPRLPTPDASLPSVPTLWEHTWTSFDSMPVIWPDQHCHPQPRAEPRVVQGEPSRALPGDVLTIAYDGTTWRVMEREGGR
jgi:hypothetical protein